MTSATGPSWRHKNKGDSNYEALLVNVSKNNQPNMVRDNYLRDYHRKQATNQYYASLLDDQLKEKALREANKQKELDWGKRFVQNDQNIFVAQQEREEQRKNELRQKYAQELKAQYLADQEAKKERNRMTRTEKRLNYDNLQAYKGWDPGLYASIPGWGGNAKYYRQMMEKDKQGAFADMAQANLLNM